MQGELERVTFISVPVSSSYPGKGASRGNPGKQCYKGDTSLHHLLLDLGKVFFVLFFDQQIFLSPSFGSGPTLGPGGYSDDNGSQGLRVFLAETLLQVSHVGDVVVASHPACTQQCGSQKWARQEAILCKSSLSPPSKWALLKAPPGTGGDLPVIGERKP